MNTIAFIQIPEVPTVERKALEHHYRQTILSPEYVLVVNYELHIDIIKKSPEDQIIVVAPGITANELVDLRERMEDAFAANAPEDQFVIVNYECKILVVPGNGNIQTYGEQETEDDDFFAKTDEEKQ